MEVRILNNLDPKVEDFVLHTPAATIYHTPQWSGMISQTFGHTPYYLVAYEENTVRGVLPLMLVRSRLFGDRIISQAFSNYGGPLIDCEGALDALIQRAIEIAESNDCEMLELRNVEPVDHDLHLWPGKVAFRIPLMSNPDELWRSFKSESKVRNHIRKAEQYGLLSIDGGIELLHEFYKVWTVRMWQLGTPCYSVRLFKAILERFPDNTRIFLAKYKDKVIGVRFTIRFNDLVESRWGATLIEYNHMRVNHFLYWAAMKYYCPLNLKWFDFGRSTIESSQHDYKKQWGAIEIPLNYQYWTRPGHKLCLARPSDPKYSKKVEVWKKLPLWITRLAGPYISRSLP